MLLSAGSHLTTMFLSKPRSVMRALAATRRGVSMPANAILHAYETGDVSDAILFR